MPQLYELQYNDKIMLLLSSIHREALCPIGTIICYTEYLCMFLNRSGYYIKSNRELKIRISEHKIAIRNNDVKSAADTNMMLALSDLWVEK